MRHYRRLCFRIVVEIAMPNRAAFAVFALIGQMELGETAQRAAGESWRNGTAVETDRYRRCEQIQRIHGTSIGREFVEQIGVDDGR